MRIDHIAIWAGDLERSKDFYVRFFAAKAGEKYVNHKKAFESYFLQFDSGARLEIMRRPDVEGDDRGADRIGLAHFAISVGSREAVDRLTETLQAAEIPVVDGPRTTGDGYYESVVLDPDGNRVELTE